MVFGSVLKCIRAFPRQTAKKKRLRFSWIYLFTIYGGLVTLQLISNIFPFSAGSFSLNQFSGCGATIFFVIAPALQRSGMTILRLANSRFMLAFGSSRSKCVTIPNHRSWSFEGCVCFPFSLFYFFAYLGVFYFIFQKKGIVLLLGSGF